MSAFALLTLVGCIENGFRNKDKDEVGETGDDTPVEDDTGGAAGLSCPGWDFPAESVGVTDICEVHEGSFHPIIEWNLGDGKYSRTTVAVGDLDLDGMPEIVANITGLFGSGTLVVARGDGSGTLWEASDADIGYGAHPAIADIDGDASPDILIVREYENSMLGAGDYTLVAYDATGDETWESAHFLGDDFDYASAISVSDMDHDGSPEINAGRVILNADGSTRGVGLYGRGSMGQVDFGGLTMDEASNAAVADLDLDGVEEVIVGNAMYAPDGTALWYDDSYNDGQVGIANLDADPEGEIIACTGNAVRAIDTDGELMWGPLTIASANILSPPAIDDLDGDGEPEIVVAGGNTLLVLNADGSRLWGADVHDMSGASGAAIFDFEGDGVPEVVYIDEVEMAAYDGATGAMKFYSTDHASDTMYDYPVIADVDADGHAEIVVAHAGWDAAVSIYGDADNSWVAARKVWNQHAYSVTNINDDLGVPTKATPNFQAFNSWHSALDDNAGTNLLIDLEGEILGVCADDCDEGVLRVAGRLDNKSLEDAMPAGIYVSLYAVVDGAMVWADSVATTAETPAGMSSEVLEFEVPADLASEASELKLVADDDGTGAGLVAECSEENNAVVESGSCP